MAVGDRITGDRSTAIMRRINALEAQPRPSTTLYDMNPSTGSNGLAIDTNDHIFLAGSDTSGIDNLHVFNTSDLSPQRLSSEYPGSETGWPTEHSLAGTDIYWQDFSAGTPTSHKYSITVDSWAELTSSDSEFDVNQPIKTDGTDLFIRTSSRAIKRFNTSGVEQSEISFDDPSILAGADTWSISVFDFDDDGNIVLSVFLNDDSAGEIIVYLFRYDTSGSQIGGTVATLGESGDGDHENNDLLDVIVNVGGSNDGYFVAVYINAASGGNFAESFNKSGTSLGTFGDTDTIQGVAYYEDEIYVFEDDDRLRVFNNAGTLQREIQVFAHTQPSQTTFYRHPNRGTDTGKVSLGTPDKGISVPSVTALKGFRPSAFEPSTMRGAIQVESAARFQEYDSGTTTSTTALKLVHTGQNFTSTVEIGDVVKNTTDGTQTTVTAIDSDTTLSLNDDIMVSGEEYIIVGPYTLSATPLARNIFDIALGSQTDWTTSTITVGDRIQDEIYDEMETVLTELETATVE